jgi:acetolactate synthase regulatory subunit
LSERAEIHVQYMPGKGAVEKVMQMCAGRGYAIQVLAVEQSDAVTGSETRGIHLQLSGRRGVEALLVAIGDIKGVVTARVSSPDHVKD